ncbi:MAG: hypothetical protein IJ298_04170 [Ruminococcus sp.]|nr:hypothetical protein [Ruminococcus sp.]
MNKFFYKVQQFMTGRNGLDRFNKFLFILYAVIIFINIFLNSLIVYLFELSLIGYIVFRTLSKNLYRRSRENQAYMKIENSVKNFFVRQKNRIRDIKTHRYIRCKHCKAQLRVKRRKGKHTVRCPKCRQEFSVNIRI